MHYRRLLTAFLLHLCSSVDGYREYALNIPNGESVPHPCKPSQVWGGVGHINEEGGGNRNRFGQDFEDAGKSWTKALCQKDSDGDGKTNGDELGDPDCTWTPSTRPKRVIDLSHPEDSKEVKQVSRLNIERFKESEKAVLNMYLPKGICDPLDSPKCQQSTINVGSYRTQADWMVDACKSSEFVCAGLNDTRTKIITLRIPPTVVPAKATTYLNKMFKFPEAIGDVHLIASRPEVDNRYVMHHMLLYGCEDDMPVLNETFESGIVVHKKCQKTLSIWALGLSGDCFHPSAGVRLGTQGYKILVIQVHWNNPGLKTNYTDSSGMTLYYTENRRPNDAEIMYFGTTHFLIPPQKESVVIESNCSSGTTRRLFSKPFYVTAAFNHMHFLGFRQKAEHIRNGSLLRYITNDEIYSYDTPKTFLYSTPVEVLPGDEIKVTCTFKSTSRTKTTVWGAGSLDEMCYVFMIFYPADAWSKYVYGCITFRSFSVLDVATYGGCKNYDLLFSNISATQLYANITENCEFLGNCRVECKEAILEARKQEPCLTSGDAWEFIKTKSLKSSPTGQRFLGAMASCEFEMYKDELATMTTSRPLVVPNDEGSKATGTGGKKTSSVVVLMTVCFTVWLWV